MKSLNVAGGLFIVEAGLMAGAFPFNFLFFAPPAALSFLLSGRNPRHGRVVGIVLILAGVAAFIAVNIVAYDSSVIGGN